MTGAEVKQPGSGSQGVEEIFKPTSYYAVFGAEYQFPAGVSIGAVIILE